MYPSVTGSVGQSPPRVRLMRAIDALMPATSSLRSARVIAVITNVLIGAHHMYTDFPNSFQQTVDSWMQPLTYAVTIPSALSLFSLGFTIYRSDFLWTPAARFLCVAMVSWLAAGLQGLGLATIQYDQVAHNTLWVVGHFHNMALLNIGLVTFAAVYAFLPALVGREWYSHRELP